MAENPPGKFSVLFQSKYFFAKSNYFAPIRLIAAGDVIVRN